MQYSELIGIEPFFDSTFNLTEEKENYWKQFITNEKFESNLKEIINAFTSPVNDHHKSIWVQGTYGTGKSHSTSVIKHLLSDDIEDIKDYIDKLSDNDLKGRLNNFRKEERVFPVVLKGTYSIVDTEEFKYTIQRAVVQQLEDANIKLSVKSDFQAVSDMITDPLFESFWDRLLDNELNRYASSKEELINLMDEGDIEVLKEINAAMKSVSMMKATPDIKKWLSEVASELRRQEIADYLVLFWDEFTSLLEISERRSILNCVQDLAELSKAPCEDNPQKTVGIYMFLVTHKSMEATDSYRELKEDEKTMAKARFLSLQYDMQDITTYHILSNALNVSETNAEKYNELVRERIELQSEVAAALNAIVAPMDKPAQTKKTIANLYPIHPYTAYLATFVSRAIGSAERSIFEFLNDERRGFKAFIENEISEKKYLTADAVWDFFVEAFSEDQTNNFSAIINKYSMYSSKLTDDDIPTLSTFKIVLLLNLLNRVTQMDDADQEKNLVNPSKRNIINVMSGEWSSDSIVRALEEIDDKQIVSKGPDDIYEVSSSAVSIEKIQAQKKRTYFKYEDVSTLLGEYPGHQSDIKRTISNAEGFNRATDFMFIWGNLSPITIETKLQKAFSNSYAAKIAVVIFRGNTPTFDKINGKSEAQIEVQKNMLQQLSEKDTLQDIIFVVSDASLGQQRFEGIIDSKAREAVAADTKLEDPTPHANKAMKWMEKWRNEIIDGAATIIFRGERVNAPSFKSVCENGLTGNVSRVFYNGAEILPKVAKASTSWKQSYAKKAVERICLATKRCEIESLMGADAALVNLLKDKNDNWIFDEELNYVGRSDQSCPMTVLIKEVEDRIAQSRNKTVVDLGQEFQFLTEAPFGYYNNPICMASIALAFRKYIGKMYLADQGNSVTATTMRDIINNAFHYWIDGKQDPKLRVRFSTAEEKELIDTIQSIFAIDGDGLSETKWNMRSSFENKYKSPLWALKYSLSKGSEFNKVIDALFSFANSTGENITQEDIINLLDQLKKQKTDISLALEKVKMSTCINSYIELCLSEVNYKLDDYTNLLAYLKQTLQDEVVFWREEDVKTQVFQWCALQGKGPTPTIENEDTGFDEPVVVEPQGDEVGEQPEFEPVDITEIVTGRTHITIESATELIEQADFDDGAKKILVQICKEYPVVCSAVIKMLS